jgi:hypothetical protein
MVVGSVPTATDVVSSNLDQDEVYNINLIKFVSDLPQVGGFLRVLWFPPPRGRPLLTKGEDSDTQLGRDIMSVSYKENITILAREIQLTAAPDVKQFVVRRFQSKI